MTQFYCLTYHAAAERMLRVTKANLRGYDCTLFWEGKEVGGFPSDLELLVSGDATDLVSNSLSWVIVSQRFLDLLSPEALCDLQVFPAPLYSNSTKELVDGYYLLNCVRRIPCLDRKRSKYEVEDEFPDELVVYELKVDEQLVPADINVFRVHESPYSGLVLRNTLVNKLIGKGLSGVAFIRL